MEPPPLRLSARAKIAGAFGIGFGFFAGAGVTGLSMLIGIMGIWAWIVGLRGPNRPLMAGIKRAVTKRWLVWGFFFAFVLWVMVSATWSPATELAGESVRRISAMVALAPLAIWAVVSTKPRDAETFHRAIAAGLAIAYVIFIIELVTGASINRLASPEKEPLAIAGDLGRAATATLALFWFGFAYLRRHATPRWALPTFVLVSLYLSFQFKTDLNGVGIVIGSLLALLALRFARFTIGLVSLGSATMIVIAPVLYPLIGKLGASVMPGGVLPLSYARRTQMWEVASDLITQKPLTGWGVGAGSTFDRTISYGGFNWPLIQLHPHAAPLHIWLETGAVGAVLAALLVVTAGFAAISTFGRHRLAAAVLVGGVSFLAIQWGLSHSAWREWMWTTLAMVIAAALSTRSLPVKRYAETYNDNKL